MVKIAGGLLKLIALVAGAFISVVSLMSIIGTYTDNGWARGGIAVLLALIVPLIFAEGALAKVAPTKVKGVTTDVLALCYLAFALVFVGVAHSYTKPMLESEGQRLASSGMNRMARAAYFLAGGQILQILAFDIDRDHVEILVTAEILHIQDAVTFPEIAADIARRFTGHTFGFAAADGLDEHIHTALKWRAPRKVFAVG